MMKNPAPTNNQATPALTTDGDLVERLKASPFYQTYQNAFRCATGLPLVLVPADRQTFNPCHASPNQNPFCEAVNQGSSPCEECALAQKNTLSRALDRAGTTSCFAAMKETAVPLRLGNRTVGYLKTGQVLTHEPDAEMIANVKSVLEKAGHKNAKITRLLESYRTTPVVSKERYASTITLLSAFGLQLAELMNRIMLERSTAEPAAVRKAKEFILDNIDERVTLDDVAEAVHVSTYYFCKIFKRATGMTFTEYVNRQRIEMAKRELLKPERRVSEIAYDVGYQSLSQFNRSFLKIVGESPSEFRKLMRENTGNVLVA